MNARPASVRDAVSEPVPVGDLIGHLLARLRGVLAAEGTPPLPERTVAHARALHEDPPTRLAYGRTWRTHSLNPRGAGVGMGRSKANLFVGDVLHLAGFDAPVFEVRGWDGSAAHEYRDARHWRWHERRFDLVPDRWQARPGDVLVATLDDDAHPEIVTDVAFVDGALVVTTLGAREQGLEEDTRFGDQLATAGDQVHLLRPRI
jgi:hypothetical protein